MLPMVNMVNGHINSSGTIFLWRRDIDIRFLAEGHGPARGKQWDPPPQIYHKWVL
jgi:hypothetical protein